MAGTSFAFIDESGVLQNDPKQPFFALGLLVLPDTAGLYHKLQLIKGQCIAQLNPHRPFEFKASGITNSFLPYYIQIADAVLDEPSAHVCVFVLDKTNPAINPLKHFPDTWEAYLRYSEIVLTDNAKHLPSDHSVVVLADYLSKPANHPDIYETRIRRLPFVPNALMLESHASLFIQVIDILTGSVVNHFFRDRRSPTRFKPCKRALADHIARRLGQTTLAASFTSTGNPSYFSVWEFQP